MLKNLGQNISLQARNSRARFFPMFFMYLFSSESLHSCKTIITFIFKNILGSFFRFFRPSVGTIDDYLLSCNKSETLCCEWTDRPTESNTQANSTSMGVQKESHPINKQRSIGFKGVLQPDINEHSTMIPVVFQHDFQPDSNRKLPKYFNQIFQIFGARL